jgi:uncharacterized protein (UPF0332 family)
MDPAIYLVKAEQCLAGAALAAAHGQYNNAANRAYYAAYQAAIAALTGAGVQPAVPRYWAHDFVLREYCARLAVAGGPYPVTSRVALKALHDERLKADYEVELIGATSAARGLELARQFVGAVRQQLGEEVACRASAHLSGPPAPSSP